MLGAQQGLPGGSDGKESTYNAGDLPLIPGWRRSPGERNGYPLQYSCLENPLDRGAWWATVHGVTKSWIGLSNLANTQVLSKPLLNGLRSRKIYHPNWDSSDSENESTCSYI